MDSATGLPPARGAVSSERGFVQFRQNSGTANLGRTAVISRRLKCSPMVSAASNGHESEVHPDAVQDVTSLVGVFADGQWFNAYFQRTDENRIVLVYNSGEVTYRPGQNVKVRLGDTRSESGVVMAGYIQSVSRRQGCSLIDVVLKEEVLLKTRKSSAGNARRSSRINCIRKGQLSLAQTETVGPATLLNYSADGICVKTTVKTGCGTRVQFVDERGHVQPIDAVVRWEIPIARNFLVGCQIVPASAHS